MIAAKACRLDELFLSGTFQPASVQREYQWTTKECGQLLGDLFDAFVRAGFDPKPASPKSSQNGLSDDDAAGTGGDDEPALTQKTDGAKLLATNAPRARKARTYPKDYFLGPMVLLPAPKAQGRYFIYDGLQRFTSLSILLAVLRDASSSGEVAEWYELQQLLRTDDGNSRLQAPTPGATLANITRSLGGSRSPGNSRNGVSQGDIQMRDAAKLFHERTADWSDARRIAFVKFLREHTHFTVTTVQDRSKAYKIFVAANDRGLQLKVGDIIKGRLVELVADAQGSTAGERVAQKWSQVQRAVRPRFDEFLRAVDFLEFGEYRPGDYGEALLDRFEDEGGAEQAATWINEELPAQAARFQTLLHHERMDPIEGVHLAFRQLYFLEDRGWQPLAMALQWAYGGDQPTWTRSIRKLANACYITELLDWAPHKRAANAARALQQLSQGKDPFQYKIGEGEYGALNFSATMRERARSALLSPITDEARRSAICRWLETLYWPRSMPKAPTRRSSVEHVLPRAAKGKWLKLFEESTRDAMTNKLGNLCVIPQDVNDDLGNGEYDVKRPGYLALPDEYRSAHEVAAYEEWNPKALEERTQAIAAKAALALGIQKRK